MIVRHFLQWVRTAPAGERAEATSALARAFLYSDLTPDDRGAAEGAMLMLLDDPSTPIWSTPWRPALRQCRPRSQPAPRCRVRLAPPSPKSAPRNPAWCWSKI